MSDFEEKNQLTRLRYFMIANRDLAAGTLLFLAPRRQRVAWKQIHNILNVSNPKKDYSEWIKAWKKMCFEAFQQQRIDSTQLTEEQKQIISLLESEVELQGNDDPYFARRQNTKVTELTVEKKTNIDGIGGENLQGVLPDGYNRPPTSRESSSDTKTVEEKYIGETGDDIDDEKSGDVNDIDDCKMEKRRLTNNEESHQKLEDSVVLSVQEAKKTTGPAAEQKRCSECKDPEIDPNRSQTESIPEAPKINLETNIRLQILRDISETLKSVAVTFPQVANALIIAMKKH